MASSAVVGIGEVLPLDPFERILLRNVAFLVRAGAGLT